MFKLVVLYRKPEIPVAEFDAKYKEHLELIAKVPGLRKAEVSRFTEAPWGQPDYFQIAELFFDNKQALHTALHSPEMGAAGQQLRSFAKGLFTMYYAEVKEF
ncbi:MAG TPA: EthD family reductase [Symbiobacteriaceae bacterium]|nr:EthD family reductase [Symbiobacteriaceae bacterium]